MRPGATRSRAQTAGLCRSPGFETAAPFAAHPERTEPIQVLMARDLARDLASDLARDLARSLA